MPALRYAYYPGCASREITKEADRTTRLVAERLSIELHDMPRASCCGAGLLNDYDYDLAIAINARIFAEAETMGMDILTICSTCLMVMCTANRDLKNSPGLLDRTNKVLSRTGLYYSGGVKVKHLLRALSEDYGLKNLTKKVVRPMGSLKVAPFYGCHSLRPSDALSFDDPSDPNSLEAAMSAIGADCVKYAGRTKCCGFQIDLVEEDIAVSMTAKRLSSMKDNKANCIVTPCPFCHINLDNYQGLADKKAGRKFELPVFHLSQLVGVAIGLSTEELGVSRHLVSPEKVLAR